jgi:hypothetical protein
MHWRRILEIGGQFNTSFKKAPCPYTGRRRVPFLGPVGDITRHI